MNPKCAIWHSVFIVFPTEYQAFHQCLLKSHFLVYKKINLHLWHNNLRISLITVIIVFVCRFVYRCGPNINQIQVERRFHISCRCVCQLYLRAQLCINISSSKLSVSVNVMVYLSVSVYHHKTKWTILLLWQYKLLRKPFYPLGECCTKMRTAFGKQFWRVLKMLINDCFWARSQNLNSFIFIWKLFLTWVISPFGSRMSRFLFLLRFQIWKFTAIFSFTCLCMDWLNFLQSHIVCLIIHSSLAKEKKWKRQAADLLCCIIWMYT